MPHSCERFLLDVAEKTLPGMSNNDWTAHGAKCRNLDKLQRRAARIQLEGGNKHQICPFITTPPGTPRHEALKAPRHKFRPLLRPCQFAPSTCPRNKQKIMNNVARSWPLFLGYFPWNLRLLKTYVAYFFPPTSELYNYLSLSFSIYLIICDCEKNKF